MKVVAFVPIKLNNERMPGKNIKLLNDRTPLIQLILKTLVKVMDDVYVFCSNEEIKEYLIDGVKFLKRPEYLDTAAATPQDIIKEFMSIVDADIYAVCHATSPFVTLEHFQECVEAVTSGRYDSSFTAEKLQKLIWTNQNEPLNFQADNVPRTQDLEPMYAEVSASYVFTKKTFIKYNRRIGINPHITVVSGAECIDIDYPEDFLIADAVYSALKRVD